MALQHFFSGVPARISMYNRADGFDTFACSQGISPSFAKGRLALIDEIKISAVEERQIMNGEFPPFYAQYFTEEGRAIQSLITYLPVDYTKERPGYFIHTLVLDEKETAELMGHASANAINPELFTDDLDSFSITSPDAKPDPNYPEKPYEIQPFVPDHWLAAEFDGALVRRLIYCVTAAVSGKLKSVFILLGEEERKSPDFMLRVVNSIFSVLPCNFRSALTFATRVNNYQHLANFKLKGVDARNSENIPLSKGVTFDLKAKNILGVKENDFNANAQTVELLYKMLRNDDMRTAFHAFADAVLAEPSGLSAANLVNLSQLVLLFRCGSGFFLENVVLPDDASMQVVFELYSKYRQFLPEPYRIKILSSINRYAETKREIPQKIFAILKKVYPTEPLATKSIIMNVALELIHINGMRDKLFDFIRVNFDNENPGMKSVVIMHLCSVFYGGFMQSKLIAFFRDQFSKLSDDAREEIVRKVLLSIRTKVIRAEIMDFLRKTIPAMNDASRSEFYACVLEQVKEGDDLAEELLAFVDKHIVTMDESFQTSFADQLFDLIAPEKSRRPHPLMSLVLNTQGFCNHAFVERMIRSGRNALLDEYVSALTEKNPSDSIASVQNLCRLGRSVDPGFESVLTPIVLSVLKKTPLKAGLSRLVEIADTLDDGPLDSMLLEKVIRPGIFASLPDVFTQKKITISVENLVKYCDRSPSLVPADDFTVLMNYLKLKNAVISDNHAFAFILTDSFPADPRLRSSIGSYMETDLDSLAKPTQRFCRYILASYLKNGAYRMADAFAQKEAPQQTPAAARDAALAEISAALTVLYTVIRRGAVPKPMRDAITSPDSGLDGLISAACSQYGSPMKSRIKEICSKNKMKNDELGVYIKKAMHRSSGGFLSFLKKK